MSRRNKDKGKIGAPFVPMLIPTITSPAWRAMSPYAREIYMRLKSRYSVNLRNNGRIYLSARDGAEETGFDAKTVARSLRELRHYGFIVATKAHCLGLDGKGTATHWRLTELGYMHDPPTKDFLKWDGEVFHEQKSPAYYKRRERSLSKLRDAQKQNPVPRNGTECTNARHIPVRQRAVHLPEEVHQGAAHVNGSACTTARHISRLTTPGPAKWSTPTITELPWSDYWASVYAADDIAAKRKRLNDLSARLAMFGHLGVARDSR
jgi:hypothetical protein